MSVFVKICGICSRSDLEQICALEPDAIGFVFWPESSRYVRPEQVARWADSIPDSVKKVGVFVAPPAQEVETIAREAKLDIVQIHQRKTDWEIDRPLFPGLEIWFAPIVHEKMSPEILSSVTPKPSALLLDCFDPETIGGTGKTADWHQVRRIAAAADIPVILAGGLTPENVAEAIDIAHSWGVDVSSGVEKSPGVKDIRKVEKFIAAVRG